MSDSLSFRLPIYRIFIREIRGIFLIASLKHLEWIRDNRGDYLNGYQECVGANSMGIWVWHREVWSGGRVNAITEPGAYLLVDFVQGVYHIQWSEMTDLDFTHAKIISMMDEFEKVHLDIDQITLPELMSGLKEMLHMISLNDPIGFGLVMVAVPEGYRVVLEGNPVMLRFYSETGYSFEPPKAME